MANERTEKQRREPGREGEGGVERTPSPVEQPERSGERDRQRGGERGTRESERSTE